MKNLIEKRAGLIAQQRALLDRASNEGRELNASENETYEKMDADITALTSTIQKAQVLDAREAELRKQNDAQGFRPSATNDRRKPVAANATDEYRAAFNEWMLNPGIVRAELQTGDDAKGGFLVPESYERSIIKLMENLDPMRMLADVRLSRSLVNIPVQAGRATFGWLGENATYPKTNPTLGRVILAAHKFGGTILASDEIVLDTDGDIEGFVAESGANATALLQSEAFMVGTGANQPLGLFSTVSVGGITVTDVPAASASALTGDELIDTVHGLKQIYRPGAAWLMRDATLKAIRKLKSNDNQYLWQPGAQAGVPDRLLGYPVYTSDFAPAIGSSARPIAFGNFKGFRIHDRLGTQVKYQGELHSDTGQVGWRFTARTDGKLVDPNAVVFLKNAA